MAKLETVDPTVAPPKKPAGKRRKKTFKKRGEKRVVHHGLAHIQASFNNTIITITDTEGNVVAWSSAGGIAQGHAVRGDPGGGRRWQCCQGVRGSVGRCTSQGARVWARVSDTRSANAWNRREVDSRYHPNSSQRLSATEAPTSIESGAWTRVGWMACPHVQTTNGKGRRTKHGTRNA